MEKYIVDGQYGRLLAENGMKLSEVLKKAELPAGLFLSARVLMTSEEYRRFMDAIGALLPSPEAYVRMATGEGIETFSPPIFAACCSRNGEECLKRLGRYKRLIGPMEYHITSNPDTTSLILHSVDGQKLSETFVVGEFLFLTNLLRKSSQKEILPQEAHIDGGPVDPIYSTYLGIPVKPDGKNEIRFRTADLELPFITENNAMWSYFEPELNKRLSEIQMDDSISAKVRSALAELLPAGKCTIDDAAEKLCMSKRSLQRRLSEENTTFQKQLNATREVLAKHYLQNTSVDVNDMAFLLGYQELNSFLRAFNVWTGMSVGEYRRNSKWN